MASDIVAIDVHVHLSDETTQKGQRRPHRADGALFRPRTAAGFHR